mmetsp:Transcript_8042/g.11654  ORF Transcript_8042/g.11654 Transcript_8042/m.11654 type:complete len:317 (+) Transcript_8042:145-1095(+)|eukprot:CAMPEP_0194255190 /NCGR_PEP_ID=MMETSP0158-20130606/33790_1 /TAXON_ID=33649 /ORGANISM="Thalassionema nitzschioides, Strain L26-B" /LENGTH=316 /DNA_ID=CAMNT_0038993469 /DNA_START=44 /DNA_END=994 /DNA_ORIENTATION=+
MTDSWVVLGISAAITVGIQFCGFVVAYILKTETFFDILGGINFLTLGVYSALAGPNWGEDSRKIACSVIFFCSRLWLLLFLAWRAYDRGGDSRFEEWIDKFWTFLGVWMFQAVWVFVISLPVVFVNSSSYNTDFSAFDYVTIVGFGLGVLIEAIADIQKARWVKAGRQGGFCQVGIWKYSRHPNYFGEILQWWEAWGFSFGSGSGWNSAQWWIGILSPLVTIQILLFTSGTGVANANGKNLKRYYDRFPDEYAEYRKSTSILIPMIGYRYVPMILKRTLFFDLKCYEYKTEDGEEQAAEEKIENSPPTNEASNLVP